MKRTDLAPTRARASPDNFERMLDELAAAGAKMSEAESLVAEVVAESRRKLRAARNGTTLRTVSASR